MRTPKKMAGAEGMVLRQDGRVFQVSVSNGGVPKYPVERCVVGPAGLAGDRQADRRAHGGPDRAVCLYSLEQLDRLADEGHPVFPGATGENVTVEGLPWAAVVPGVRLKLGDAVLLEVTGYAAPCWKNARWFADGDITRISQERAPGWSRVYAKVIAGGSVAAGDTVDALLGTASERIERTRTPVFRWPQDFRDGAHPKTPPAFRHDVISTPLQEGRNER